MEFCISTVQSNEHCNRKIPSNFGTWLYKITLDFEPVCLIILSFYTVTVIVNSVKKRIFTLKGACKLI